ncbi:hypothetical protein ZWY2020_018380 [Hordeum vulgare]|nr:hypothetical protein ZWY2020_018380 [Hordeum vulgare]
MILLRKRVVSHPLSAAASSPSISPLLFSAASSPSISPLLFSAPAAPRISPNPSFAVEDYLVDTCGLTRAQALKASTRLSHLKSPANPDAVLAFLAGLGLSGADVAALVVKDPLFLCAGVERTLSTVLVGLTRLGLSPSDIARLVSLTPAYFGNIYLVPKLEYYLPLFGSIDDLFRQLKHSSGLLSSHLESAVKPNVAFLRECGLGACDIAKLPRIIAASPERVLGMVACAESIGVPRGSGMFRHALHAVSFLNEEDIAAKVEQLKKTLRWSDAEVRIAVSRWPVLLRWSKDMLQRKSEFLVSKVGLEPAYIARRPVMIGLSLEGRLKPRYYVMRFLKENALLNHDTNYYTMFLISEKAFVEKFICPHKQAAPHIAEDYAAACTGEMPARFRFT